VGELERLRNDVDIELKETGRWVTTFTRIQCWGRDKNRPRLPSTSPASTSLQESVGTLVPATMITGYARRRVRYRGITNSVRVASLDFCGECTGSCEADLSRRRSCQTRRVAPG
jgi:hypothetical protein